MIQLISSRKSKVNKRRDAAGTIYKCVQSWSNAGRFTALFILAVEGGLEGWSGVGRQLSVTYSFSARIIVKYSTFLEVSETDFGNFLGFPAIRAKFREHFDET